MAVGNEMDQRTRPPADDWDVHWNAFNASAERNPAQEYRRQLVLFLLGRFGPPERLLDIGCGNGDFLASAQQCWPGAQLAGMDLSASAVAEARRKVPDARLRAFDLVTESVPLPDEAGWASHAVCAEVLEHVDDPVAVLRSARGWLAPGCRLVITVPGGPMSAYDRHIGHRRHFSSRDLAAVMNSAGLQVAVATGAGFPFFNLYRAVVIARGERLIDDVGVRFERSRQFSVARMAMATFRPLLPLSLPRSRFGWQTVAVGQAV